MKDYMKIESGDSIIDISPAGLFSKQIERGRAALWQGFKFTVYTLYETPAEAAAFAVAAIVMRIFFSSLAPPFMGICVSLIGTRLIVKALDHYCQAPLIEIKRQVCLLNKNFPRLQLVGFISALVISLLSQTLGFAMGLVVGAFGSVILDVENYKLMQQAKRDRFSQESFTY
jgi:hypothetical protein